MMSPVEKLRKRISVHDKYAIAAGLAMCELEKSHSSLWKIGDSICSSIISYYQSKQRISEAQMQVLKARLPKYAEILHENTDIVKFIPTDSVVSTATKDVVVDRSASIKAAIWADKSKHFIVSFPYDVVIVEALKTLPGSIFNMQTKTWKIKRSLEAAYLLEELGFEFDDAIKLWLQKFDTRTKREVNNKLKVKGLKGEMRPFQVEGVSFIEANYGRGLIADEMGLGKAQPLNSLLLTPRGYIELRNCKIGDEIFGNDGRIYNIEGIFYQGVKQTYKVSFSDGTCAYCCEDHLWSINTPYDKWKNVPDKVVPLRWLFNKKLTWSQGYNYFIPMSSPLQFKYVNTYIDPYLIGVLLGDGFLSTGTVGVSNPDKDVIDEVKNILPCGITLKKCSGDNVDYTIVWDHKTTEKNPIKAEIKRLGINKKSYEKHIPIEYKYNDIQSRVALLQGLLDTDGYASESVIQYSTSSKQLHDDVQFIVESLGGRAASRNFIPEYTYKGEKRKGKRAYELTIKLPSYIAPFRCKRKLEKVLCKNRKEPTRAITSIEKDIETECACIKTSAPNSLYLTNNCIVTHNTVQGIAWIQHNNQWPAVVLCPASLKYNWEREISKWLDGISTYVLNGKPDTTKNELQAFDEKYVVTEGSSKKKVIIVNYDILSNSTTKEKDTDGKTQIIEKPYTGWVDFLIDLNLKTVVLDECHLLKNRKTLRTIASLKVASKIDSIVCLTGTPVLNRPIEFYNIINLINPYLFPNYMEYAREYCDAKHTAFGWDFKGASNTKQLHDILDMNVMVRRLKKDVLPELPEKVRTIVPIEISNKKEYLKASENLIQWYIDNGLEEAATNAERAAALTRIQALRNMCIEGKLEGCIEWVENFLESDEKLVVFCVHHKVVDALMTKFKHFNQKGIAVSITGDTSVTNRQKMVDIFQNEPDCRLFVGNIQAAGVGLTLTQSSNVAFIEFPWTPAELLQAEDRVHRIGQTSDSVNAWYLAAMGTIDEEIAMLIDAKMKVSSSIVDGTDIDDDAIFTTLFTDKAISGRQRKPKAKKKKVGKAI